MNFKNTEKYYFKILKNYHFFKIAKITYFKTLQNHHFLKKYVESKKIHDKPIISVILCNNPA